MLDEKRSEPRYAARIVCRIVRRGEREELLTNDVSFRGAFLRTGAPPALRQLVKVTFALPDGELVIANAMVVHVVPPGSDRVPGAGLQFWGSTSAPEPWERFLQELRARERNGVPQARATDRVRRSSRRFKLTLAVVLDGRDAVTRDVSVSGMAVRTEVRLPVGVRTSLHLHVPPSPPILVNVIVRRQIDEPGFRGLGVEFMDLAFDERAAIVETITRFTPPSQASAFG